MYVRASNVQIIVRISTIEWQMYKRWDVSSIDLRLHVDVESSLAGYQKL